MNRLWLDRLLILLFILLMAYVGSLIEYQP